MQYTKGPCKHCQQPTVNPTFCSRSCSVAFNNARAPKRKLTHQCVKCSKPILSNVKYCKDCLIYNNWESITIAQVIVKAKYQIHSYIRNLARRLYKTSKKPRCCHNCGYDKHIEICHIRAINSFPTTSFISEVNSITNLVALCPNCHWEFDHNLLKLKI